MNAPSANTIETFMRTSALILTALVAIGSSPTSGAEVNRHISGQQAWKENLKESHSRAVAKANEAHATSLHTSGTVHEAAEKTKSASGSPYTIENLIARVETNPQRFASYHSVHAAVILERDIQLRAMIAQGLCPSLNGIYEGGLLAQTPYHRYLEYRRSLNPARFDACHPLLGPIIAEDARIRAYTMACMAAQTLTPPGGGSGGGSGAGTPGGENGSGGGGSSSGGGSGGGNVTPLPPAVPAPAGLILMAVGSATLMLGKGWAARRRGRIA